MTRLERTIRCGEAAIKTTCLAIWLAILASPAAAQDYQSFRTCVLGPSGMDCVDTVMGCGASYHWTDIQSQDAAACYRD